MFHIFQFSSIVVLHGLASHAFGLASDAFDRLLQLLQHLGLTSQLCGDLSKCWDYICRQNSLSFNFSLQWTTALKYTKYTF